MANFQIAPRLCFLISSGSKKKEHRCVCLSEAKASHYTKCGTEVSSSVPHFLQVGLLPTPITYRRLLRVLCPVSRPITTLDCVLLKDNNQALLARSGARDQFLSLSLCTTRTTPYYQMLVIHPAFNLTFNILSKPPRDGSVPINF